MRIWIDVEDGSGNQVGDGPIVTATQWESAPRLDEGGTFAFTMPAGDPRAALLQNKRVVRCYGIVEGTVQELGAGVVDTVEADVGDPTMLRISGPDLLAELAGRSVRDLRICEQDLVYLTYDADMGAWKGSVRRLWDRYGATGDIDLPAAHDGVTDSGGDVIQLWREADIYADYVYVGCDARFDRVYITLGAQNNDVETVLVGQYFNGEGWEDLPDLWDGTAHQNGYGEWCTFYQSGVIVFTRPADWARTTPTAAAGSWFWVRFTVASGQATRDDTVLREAAVWADVPTTDGVNQIMAFAPDTWVRTGYPATATPKYLEFDGESVLSALIALAEQGGQDGGEPVREHFRLGSGREIDWLDSLEDSGLRAVQPGSAAAVEGNADVCLIRRLKRRRDTSETVTRIYPVSADGITLALTTRSAPAGYTLSKAGEYLELDAGITAYGRIEVQTRFTDVSMQQADSYYIHPSMAANALFDRALEWLRTHGVATEFYDLEVTKVPGPVLPGETVDVVYHEYRDGYHAVAIDTVADGAPLTVLGTRVRVDSDGIHTVGLDVATVDRQAASDERVLVSTIQDVRRLRPGLGAVTSIYVSGVSDVETEVTIPDLALNSTILLKTGVAYPSIHPGSEAGLIAACSLAEAGDVIWLPTDTIACTTVIAIPAGVCVWGRGHSTIAGTVQLDDGSQLNAMGVILSGDQSEALVGIVGPDSGRADVTMCWIEVSNAGGPAYGIQMGAGEVHVRNTPIMGRGTEASYALYGECDNAHLYSCEPVLAETAGADSNPFGETAGVSETLSTVGQGSGLGLWNGSGNDSPPPDWYAAGFDDSAWLAVVECTLAVSDPIPAADRVTYTNSDLPDNAEWLHRRVFTVTHIPAGGALQVGADGSVQEVYLNGELLWSGDSGLESIPIPADQLQMGDNLLATKVTNGVHAGLNVTFVAYDLDVSSIGIGEPYVHACAIADSAGRAAAIAVWGDRSAWNTADYADRHASDIAANVPTRHNPLGTAAGQAPVWDGSKWVATDVATQDELDAHTGDTGNPHEVTATQVGLGNVANLLDKLDGTAAPTANDGSAAGYAVGSRWLDVTNGNVYVCLDATEGAAVWEQLNGGGGGGVTVEEEDGTPSVAADTIKFPNGRVTDNGDGSVSVTFPSGGTVEAADVTYTPTTVTDWDSDADPGNVDDALDQLAERVDDVEAVSGGMVLIAESVLTSDSASFDFTSIPATFRHLRAYMVARGTDAAYATGCYVRLNGDSGNNYDFHQWQLSSTSFSGAQGVPGNFVPIGPITAASAPAGETGSCMVEILNYANTSLHKHVHAEGGCRSAASTMLSRKIFGVWKSTAAVNRVTLFGGAQLTAGSTCQLYGLL